MAGEELTRRHFVAGALATATLGLSGCTAQYGSPSSYLTNILQPQNQNTVFHWIDVALQQIRDQRLPPPRAAYNLAFATVAGFVAANAVEQKYHNPYGIGRAPAGTDPELAYGEAFAVAAAEAYQQPFVAERNRFAQQFPDGEIKTISLDWGRRVGRHIVQLRTNDGSEPSKANFYLGRYQRRNDSLRWRPTGPMYSARPGPAFPSYLRPLFPGQGHIKPWSMTSGSQFRAPDFYDPASPEFAEEFDNIRRLGGADSTTRTADEAEIALFWEDGPWGLTPPGHFLYVGMQALQDRSHDFISLARTYAMLGMSQCDSSISAWDSKYAHDILRPETAIRHRANHFHNPDSRVVGQANWRSLIPTPEFPAYTSGHSTFGASASVILAHAYGSDRISLSHEPPDQVIWPQISGVTRSWNSFSHMAEENGLSRLYGGVHWLTDHDQAMYAGKAIGRQILAKSFQRRG